MVANLKRPVPCEKGDAILDWRISFPLSFDVKPFDMGRRCAAHFKYEGTLARCQTKLAYQYGTLSCSTIRGPVDSHQRNGRPNLGIADKTEKSGCGK